MFDLFHVILYLHALGAIVAFGPTFVFPIIGGQAAGEPQHGNFALRVSLVIEERLVIPVALSMAVTGVGVVLTAEPSLPITQPWLLAGIALYVIAMVLAIGVMRPTVIRLIALTSQPPRPPAGGTPVAAGGAPGAMPAGSAAAGGQPAGPPAGPPPAVRALIRRQQLTGMVLSVLLFVIVLVMIFQPGGAGA